MVEPWQERRSVYCDTHGYLEAFLILAHPLLIIEQGFWGSGSGLAAATVAGYGDVVLAEYTQPFNENDVTYYRPLYQQTVVKKDVNWERGGLLRVQLDRRGPLYKAIYTQRTSCERPKVRNRRSFANLNNLIYVVINVRALDRDKFINRRLLQMS